MVYTLNDIATIIGGYPVSENSNSVKYLVMDSRKIYFPAASLFFALKGSAVDGHNFIADAYQKVIRSFVVSQQVNTETFPGACFIIVPDTLNALQLLTAHHRRSFNFPVIGITGSRGKTMVKEWLFQLLNSEYNIVRSPRSYNSQVGVPLALWQMDDSYDLGIFEAGISEAGEMVRLEKMIKPTVGVFTFLGDEHEEGFENIEQKIEQKLLLFSESKVLIYGCDDVRIEKAVKRFKQISNEALQVFTWGYSPKANLQITDVVQEEADTIVTVVHDKNKHSFDIPFKDNGSVQNAITCLAVAFYLDMPVMQIKEKLRWLRPLQLRMELKEAVNDCSLVIDRYQADVNSLHIALDFLHQQQQYSRRTVILSDLNTTSETEEEDYKTMAGLLSQKDIYRFIGVGPMLTKYGALFNAIGKTHFYHSGKELLQGLSGLHLNQETILLKGSKAFGFDSVSQALEKKLHQTFLEIDLNAMRHNLKLYRQIAGKGVKMMCMVKAFSYGSGSFEIANLLQHAGVDYLGVAYADEGVALRKAGIRLPIMVMNTEEAGFQNIIEHCLEPELYSFRILEAFNNFLKEKGLKEYLIHLKIETGMHRLGFEQEDLPELCAFLKYAPTLRVRSVFSHLAASGEREQDEFTRMQGQLLINATRQIEAAVGYPFLTHINNTAGIHRHQGMQWDMVRLGIGMYGIDADDAMQEKLKNVTTLKTTISQVKKIKAGDSVGYSRSAIAENEKTIATVRIGYADGYPRLLGNGVGYMIVNGAKAPVIGRICMDMTMLDITGINAREEDEVIVFGESLPVSYLAKWAHTIEYEILTSISQRVRRVYYEE